MQRILVIVTRQLGDVLLTTPLIRAARQRWPQARLEVLGFAGTLGLLRGNPDIDALIEAPSGGWRRAWPAVRRLWRRYDLALVAQPSDRAHLYGWVAAPRRAGLVTWHRDKSWWQRRLLAHAVEVPASRSHVVLEKLALLDPWSDTPVGAPRSPAAGAPPERPAPVGAGEPAVAVVPPPAAPLPAEVDAALSRWPVAPVVLQVPSLVAYKQWPLAHCAALVRGLAADGRPVVLTGSGSAADRQRVAEVREAARGNPPGEVLDVAGQLDLNQVAALLARAALYIGPDTSITHLAAAVGVPTIALYGPVDPRIFGPWPAGHPARQPWLPRSDDGLQQRPGVWLLQGTQSCVPCNGAGCEGHDASRSDCLQSIGPERVLALARTLLRTPAGR
ncbi:glycosyltransferase family 9 protein [Piscinibacter sakaiensis]|uniref:ADP-heptose--lipooligosaccharide heptosyltransferase II n=1 Tax=Piscinibacter sakaiensis TaxID=1547922 RepID=A0A0K8P2B0_PISS1|nr:glycosyltransferase family 9 protein [Piscinibacter sakaiensis]GAP36664.1 ADP-heptose--lipooligosaccharide heptosyltransferase II [Piscinibacter sakaiensis]